MEVRYHSRFFVRVGHETMYVTIGNHHFFTIHTIDLTKLLRTSVKPAHKFYRFTGFTEVLSNFGRSGDDMVY
jgi:hypothetical protein